MLFVFVTLCCSMVFFVNATFELLASDDGSIVENINEIVDEIIPDIAQQIKTWNMDPLDVGNLRSRELSDCEVTGLSRLYRSGDCFFTSPNERDGLLQAHIGFERIIGTCDFSKRVLFYTHRGTLEMRIPNVSTFVRISQMMEPTARPVLEFMDVTVPRGMTLEAFGSNTVNLALDALQIFYQRRMRRVIEDVLRERIQEILLSYLSMVTLEDINKAIDQDNHLLVFNNTISDTQ